MQHVYEQYGMEFQWLTDDNFGLGTHTRELCVCDLSAVLGVSQSAISHQLRVLRSARLVRYRKVGKIVYYALADAHVVQFIDVGVDHARESQPR